MPCFDKTFICLDFQKRTSLTGLLPHKLGQGLNQGLVFKTVQALDISIINMDIVKSIHVAGTASLVRYMALILKQRLHLMS